MTTSTSRRVGQPVNSPRPWTPPFTTFVVKVQETCNLNCTYCYMYNLADTSYLTRPKRMSESVRDALFLRLREHALAHGIDPIVVGIHGGEPLLVGRAYLDEWAGRLRETLKGAADVRLRLQTNGILLDERWVELFHRHGLRIGISIDGPQRYNDRFRVDHAGRGAFDRAVAGLRRLTEHDLGPEVFGAVLSVANPEVPAKEMWEFWRNLGITRYDFNLPHCTHDHPPWFDQPSLTTWMIELFDLWWTLDDPVYEVRFFRNVVNLILGAPFSTDYIGGKPGGIAVVETDGAIQGTDALKACEEGMVDLGLFVETNSFDEALQNPIVQLANHSSAQLSQTCQGCEVREVCGGGYLPHRYRRANGFDNPSVYCESLYAIIHHIRSRIVESLGGLRREP